MRITLSPVSNPELEKIEIPLPVFTIGRNEPPFSKYPESIRKQLGPRLARIFIESGEIYLVGPRSIAINDLPCEHNPEKLRAGDVLRFSDQLAYRLEVSAAVQSEPLPPPLDAPVILTLLPEQTEFHLQAIVISKFPFLVSKTSAVFSESGDRFNDYLKFLSRRHAYIFLKDGKVYLEDLNSTNGTFLSGKRLESEACPLKDGDIISFGEFIFVYRVSLIVPEVPSSEQLTRIRAGTQHVPGNPVRARTTFVECPSSFLEIYCDQDEAKDKQGGISSDEAKNAKITDHQSESGSAGPFLPGPRRLTSRLMRSMSDAIGIPPKIIELLRLIRNSAGPSRTNKKVGLWSSMAAGALAIVLGGYAILWFLEAPEREIKELIKTGQYEAAVKQANDYLQLDPQDEDLNELVAEATLMDFIPAWMAYIKTQRYDEARALIDKARNQVLTNNSNSTNTLDAVAWVGELEQYSLSRSEAAQLSIFRDEEAIESLLNRWEQHGEDYRRALANITLYIPQFETLRTRAFSHLGKFRNYQDSYLAAVVEIKRTVREKLRNSAQKDLVKILEDFKNRYPAIDGIQALEQDLELYLNLSDALAKKDPERISFFLDETRVQTPPFKEKIDELKITALPPLNVLAKYRESSQAWRSGETKVALALLKELTSQAWGDVARGMLVRDQTILNEYIALTSAKSDQRHYQEQLMRFHKMLDPEEDTYFFQLIENDFKAYRDETLAAMASTFQLAREHWETYQNNGGIRGMLRLEGYISDAYRRQATLLSQAYKHIDRIEEVYHDLNIPLPEGYAELRDAVTNDVRAQRRSLEDLRAVFEPRLLNEKLKLLAEPQEPGT